MIRTLRIVSISVPVSDQDEALRFYTDVLGFELRGDAEAWPGARAVEIGLPGTGITIVLLPHGSEIPMAMRVETDDVQSAHAQIVDAGVRLHNEHVLHLDGSPPMFHFEETDGNGLVFLQRERSEQ